MLYYCFESNQNHSLTLPPPLTLTLIQHDGVFVNRKFLKRGSSPKSSVFGNMYKDCISLQKTFQKLIMSQFIVIEYQILQNINISVYCLLYSTKRRHYSFHRPGRPFHAAALQSILPPNIILSFMEKTTRERRVQGHFSLMSWLGRSLRPLLFTLGFSNANYVLKNSLNTFTLAQCLWL